MAKAVALFSGGLDSTLAILVMLRQGIKVTAVTFLNHFGCDISDRSSCSKNPFSAAEKFGFEVKLSHLSKKFLDIVKNPKYGHGKNMNPCIDCRILMLKEAREFMNMTGADFIITGEVLGQRPMSQRKNTFPLIDKEAMVNGYVLRPLSAKLLDVTIPEQMGIVSRDMLYDFSGRSRKPQMALAKEFGLIDYPTPAGGCLLTEPNYAFRLKELLAYNKDPEFKDINLLRIGRHFRFSPECKIIVGRNKEENDMIISLSDSRDHILKVEGYGSPITLIAGKATNEALAIAASMCARYSDAKHLPEVNVTVSMKEEKYYLKVQPANNEIIESLRIDKKPPALVLRGTAQT
ncbi:MAG: 7-cyano-7-deazaguanine synthase [Thermodesulfovibrionia bacterium]|nr:7-cyano-7-deazaguanine synthase [Thermodesulfovibrionia bacterium]